MLQAGAHVDAGQCRPDGVLVHGVGVLGPDGEVLGVRRELVLQAFHHGLILEEQHRAGAGGKGSQLVLGGLELVGRHDGSQCLLGQLPEFFMLGAQQDHQTGGLRVERRRRVLDGMLDGLHHIGGRHRQLLVQRVDGTTFLGGLVDVRNGHV